MGLRHCRRVTRKHEVGAAGEYGQYPISVRLTVVRHQPSERPAVLHDKSRAKARHLFAQPDGTGHPGSSWRGARLRDPRTATAASAAPRTIHHAARTG
jgi:hypothetical protein